uniref:BRCT domain-containing protein n=1 Tax=Gongylonema pulchrum TaxID=637853 RepID=A0A183E5S6_9BILA
LYEIIEKNNLDVNLGGFALTDDGASEWNTFRCDRENDRVAAFLAQGKYASKSVIDQELAAKIASLDIASIDGQEAGHVSGDASQRHPSIAASDVLNVTSTAELLSMSQVVVENLGGIRKKFFAYSSTTQLLFEKLQGCARFLKGLLDKQGKSDQAQELIDELEKLHISIEQFSSTVLDISRDFEGLDFLYLYIFLFILICIFYKYLFYILIYFYSFIIREKHQRYIDTFGTVDELFLIPLIFSVSSFASKTCNQLNVELANEKQKAIEAAHLSEQLQGRICDLEKSNQKITDELNSLKNDMAVKEEESANVAMQLRHVNEQYASLFQQANELRKTLEIKEYRAIEKDNEMKREMKGITEQCQQLQIQLAETVHTLGVKEELNEALRAEVDRVNEQLANCESELAHCRAVSELLLLVAFDFVLQNSCSVNALLPLFAWALALFLTNVERQWQIAEVSFVLQEIMGLENKVNETIRIVKESLGIVYEPPPTNVLMLQGGDAETAALNQLAQIEMHLDEFVQVSHTIAELRARSATLQRDAEFAEKTRNGAEAKCREMQEKIGILKQKVQDLEEEVRAERRSRKTLEMELQQLSIKNSCIKENFERVAKTLAETERKYEDLLANRNRSSLAESYSTVLCTATVGTMTSLTARELEQTDSTAALSSFAKRMYLLAAEWQEQSVSEDRSSFTANDLERLYNFFSRMLKHLNEKMEELRNQLVVANSQLRSMEFDAQENRQP